MVIDDQDGQLHQTSVASPAPARTRANLCFTQPTGDSPDDDSPARRLAPRAWLPYRPRLRPHHPAPSHFQMHAGAALAETADRRAGRHAPPPPRTPPDAHPGDHAGSRPASAVRRQLDTGQHAARCSPAPLLHPTSPTPELAHMAVRLWPIDRPASRADSAIRACVPSRMTLRSVISSEWRSERKEALVSHDGLASEGATVIRPDAGVCSVCGPTHPARRGTHGWS